jgi:hypothetical protein
MKALMDKKQSIAERMQASDDPHTVTAPPPVSLRFGVERRFGPASDVEVLVEFEPSHIPGPVFPQWKKS